MSFFCLPQVKKAKVFSGFPDTYSYSTIAQGCIWPPPRLSLINAAGAVIERKTITRQCTDDYTTPLRGDIIGRVSLSCNRGSVQHYYDTLDTGMLYALKCQCFQDSVQNANIIRYDELFKL